MGRRDADYCQAHKDEPEEWGEPEPTPKSGRRRLAAMVSIRLTPEEEEFIRDAALQTNQSLSHFIRQAALRAARSRGALTRGASLSTLSSTSTTSFGGTTEMLTGSVLVQFSEASLVQEEVQFG